MRSDEEMLHLIVETGKKNGALAIGISGSRTDSQVQTDQWQDFDIIYLMADIQPLVEQDAWLNAFGPRLIMQTPDAPSHHMDRFAYLMLFEDGQRIDLTLRPLSALDILSEEPGIEPLYDPNHLLKEIKATDRSIFHFVLPNQDSFTAHCNEFWWVSTYVVKGLCRNQLIYAVDHLYQICWQELLWIEDCLLAIAAKDPINVGKNHKFLPQLLERETFDQLTAFLRFTTIEACGDALIAIQERFDQSARQVSQLLSLTYDTTEAFNVKRHTKKWSEEKWGRKI